MFYELNIDLPPSLPLFNISPCLSISALHLTDLLCWFSCILMLVYIYMCVSRCSATTTSCIWSQWASPMQASMSARPSFPGSEWERLRLHSPSTVSYFPIIFLHAAKPCFYVKHGRWVMKPHGPLRCVCLIWTHSVLHAYIYISLTAESPQCTGLSSARALYLCRPKSDSFQPKPDPNPTDNFPALNRPKANISMSKLFPWETGNYLINQNRFTENTMTKREFTNAP